MFRVADLGKRGVPGLSRAQRAAMATITPYVPPPRLRFSLVDPSEDEGIAIFAGAPSCLVSPQVLNAPNCNAVFHPIDGAVGTVPDCIGYAARPWVPHDRTSGAVAVPNSYWKR